MPKSYKRPVHRDTKARTTSGLLSLLWMVVGVVIMAMVGVFLYLSPLFDSFRNEVEVNPSIEVVPLPQQPKSRQYEFYEVLPNREFSPEGGGLGEETVTQERQVKIDKVIDMPDESINSDDIDELQQSGVVQQEMGADAQLIAQDQESVSDKKRTYILQIHNYQTAEEADKKRAEVMMAGVDAKVIHRNENGVSLYQVVSTPMTDKERAMQASWQLKEVGIDSLLIEQRH